MIYEHVSELIGNTPLLRVPQSVHGLHNIDLFAKLEYQNPFGSLKDRIALNMLSAIRDDVQANNKTVLESSSGNTAKALAALCQSYGIPFKTVTSRIRYPEVRMILQVLGAEIEELPSISECPDPFDPDDFLAVAKKEAEANPDRIALTDQYFNDKNPQAHASTGQELLADLGSVDYFVSVLGTCGSTTGVGSILREANPNTQVFGVVSAPGHVLPGGRMATELWEVGFFDKDFYDDILEGNTVQAIDGMLALNRGCAMLCGPTTGLTYSMACERLRIVDNELKNSGARANAVFIACDRIEPYTSFLRKHRPELFDPTRGNRARVQDVTAAEQDAAPAISVNELEMELSKDPPLIIDVRGNFAYSIGHIEGSANVVDEIFTTLIEQGRIFDQKRIVVVCPTGKLSRKYAQFMIGQGYDACSLADGLSGWKRAGKPLVKSV